MDCPICNGKTEVIDSRKRSYGVWRRRQCLECKSRFNTQEILSLNASEISRRIGGLKKAISRMQDSINAINELIEQGEGNE